MAKIHVLSAHIANQIAAGEVVERPASIVKELVENAVDAGAGRISIEIENGGLELIRISDNGCGISDADAETAFLRHATSKLNKAEDLSHIDTLGFRGEALASIAAVSCVTLKTCAEGEELGSSIRIRGGALEEHKRIGCAAGSVMEVRELFYNTPARLKFLKSARAESGALGDYVQKLIMSLPGIAITYINNGRTVYQSSGDGDLRNAILSVYGVECAKQLCELHFDDGYLKIEGFIGLPSLSRLNRSAQSIFLNRRIVRSAALANALSRAYDTRLMSGRFPFAVVALQLASAEVDVNVHPAKLEVRFRDEQRVIRSVYVACSEALTRSAVPSALEAADDFPFRPVTPETRAEASWMPERPRAWRGNARPYAVREGYREDMNIPRVSIPSDAPRQEMPPIAVPESVPFAEPYTVIGSAFMTYWFVQQGGTLYCIDQHAAHERLLYDALMQRSETAASQTLLFPETVTLSPGELETLHAFQKDLEDFGFSFGDAQQVTVPLLAVPQVRGRALNAAFLHDALHRLAQAEPGALRSQDVVRESITQSACKHAVKAGEPLTAPQIETLLEALSASDVPLTCPHGRPIVVRFSKTALEKWFKRIP